MASCSVSSVDNMSQDSINRINRRKVLQSVGVAGGLVTGCLGDGNPIDENNSEDNDEYPQNEIKIVVPFSAGGGFDQYSRILANHLPDYLPNTVDVRVTNVTGSGGVVAYEQIYDSEPDGYTFAIAHIPSAIMNQHTQDVDYDFREMTFLPQVEESSMALFVGEHTDIESWDDFVAAAQNEEFNYGGVSPTSSSLAALAAAGEETGSYSAQSLYDNLIVYNGTSEVQQGILRGDADGMMSSYEAFEPIVEAGDARVPFIAAGEDVKDRHPEADTIESADLEEVREIFNLSTINRIFFAPPGLSEQRATILRKSITEAIHSDNFQAEADEVDRPINYASSEEVEELVLGAYDSADVFLDVLELAEKYED